MICLVIVMYLWGLQLKPHPDCSVKLYGLFSGGGIRHCCWERLGTVSRQVPLFTSLFPYYESQAFDAPQSFMCVCFCVCLCVCAWGFPQHAVTWVCCSLSRSVSVPPLTLSLFFCHPLSLSLSVFPTPCVGDCVKLFSSFSQVSEQ